MKSNEELKAWIALGHVTGVGAKTYQKLLSTFKDPQDVFKAKPATLEKAGISPKLANIIYEQRDNDTASEAISWLSSANNHTIITLQCAEYPALLKQIDNPPPLLYVKGNYTLLNDPQLAIIGSRNPTRGGTENAYGFSKYLGKTGLCITSGLALGIDGTAHKGALDGGGSTIAVIATGIDRVYPASHRELAHKIVEHGAIVSEFAMGTQPKAENFPRRNRIISGLAYGTLVVESALQSGSLITARLAMEQNREVFAIPGSIHNPLAKGNHSLIRQGAKLVETAQDILEEMAGVIDLNIDFSKPVDLHEITKKPQSENSESNVSDNSEYQELLDKMGFDPIAIDQLVIETDYSPEALSTMLLMLELQNKVSSDGGGTYTQLGNTSK